MARFDLSREWGTALMFAASAAGAAVALWNYRVPGSGIDGTAGALLVVLSSLLLAIDSIFLFFLRQGPLRSTLLALGIVAAIGTLVAAWFLHAWALMAAMAFALAGIAASIVTGPAARPVRLRL